MNKFYKFSFAIIASVLMLASITFSQVSKQKNDSISSKVDNENNNCMEMLNFYKDSLVRAGRAGGMAWTLRSCEENLTFPQLSSTQFILENNLDLITQKNRNYSWKNEDGVINLLPSDTLPELLRIRIKDLKISFDTNLLLVVDTILKTSEVVTQIKKLKLEEGMYFGGLSSPPSKRPPTEMTFHNKTVQEVLNEVVRKHGRGVWLYRESYYDGANTFTLDFVVQ